MTQASKITAVFAAAFMLAATGCGIQTSAEDIQQEETVTEENSGTEEKEVSIVLSDSVVSTASVTSGGILDASDYFTERDLLQTPDLADAQYITLSDSQDITITEEGVYVLSGKAQNVTVRVEADDAAKVQIVLDGAEITNTSAPAIYVLSADKVFVTTTDSVNTLTVTGAFEADGDTNTDAVIFSKDDIVLNGLGTLNISSSDNGIAAKDDLKITGGTYNITAASDGIEANDSVRICCGNIVIESGNDGIQVKNDDDTLKGNIYICGGIITIDADDDAIHGAAAVQIDGGTIDLEGAEGIEGTYVQINGGSTAISASDDGINAGYKSDAYSIPVIEITGGEVNITMGAGDTDAIDSNGSIYISGGNVNISAQFAFDFDYEAQLSGGTVTVNGSQVDAITNSMMGGMQGFGGQQGGMPGQGGWGGRP